MEHGISKDSIRNAYKHIVKAVLYEAAFCTNTNANNAFKQQAQYIKWLKIIR